MSNIDENIYDKLNKETTEVSRKFEHIANIESKSDTSKNVISSGVRMIGNNDSLFDSLSKANLDSAKVNIDSMPDSGDFNFLSK